MVGKGALQEQSGAGAGAGRARGIRPFEPEESLADRELRGGRDGGGDRRVAAGRVDVQVNAGIERVFGVANGPAGKNRLLPGVALQGDLVYHRGGGRGVIRIDIDFLEQDMLCAVSEEVLPRPGLVRRGKRPSKGETGDTRRDQGETILPQLVVVELVEPRAVAVAREQALFPLDALRLVFDVTAVRYRTNRAPGLTAWRLADITVGGGRYHSHEQRGEGEGGEGEDVFHEGRIE